MRKHIKTHTTINHNKIDRDDRFDRVDVNDDDAFKTIVAIMSLPFLSVLVVVVVVVMIVDAAVVVDDVPDQYCCLVEFPATEFMAVRWQYWSVHCSVQNSTAAYNFYVQFYIHKLWYVSTYVETYHDSCM